MEEKPLDPAGIQPDFSPEARRRQAVSASERLQQKIMRQAGPGTRFFVITRRVATGAYYDGFIHAGNFAYMTILALFPFFIVVAAIFSVVGEQGQLDASISAMLSALPPRVADLIEPVARNVATARQGWLLWIGCLFGFWTAGSLIETIRDVLHRAYGTEPMRAFWYSRLASTGMIFGAVLLLLIALSAQVMLATLQEILFSFFPRLTGLMDEFLISRLVGAGVLFGSIYLLFVMLTPAAYQKRRYPKWPGALTVTIWWVLVTLALPRVLRNFFTYDLTYGNLAGVMVALFFFWLVGLGMVVGAELNAALAETPEERKALGTATNGKTGEQDETREDCE